MKLTKKISALLMAITIIVSISIPAFATNEQTSASTHYSQFRYTVYDRDGNIKETGITPDFNARYSWRGITLENGEAVDLYPTNQNYFFIYENTEMEFELVLDRVANWLAICYEGIANDYSAGEAFAINYKSYGVLTTRTIEKTGPYFITCMNVSSDPFEIITARVTF